MGMTNLHYLLLRILVENDEVRKRLRIWQNKIWGFDPPLRIAPRVYCISSSHSRFAQDKTNANERFGVVVLLTTQLHLQYF